jgi:hypothetical protein
VTSTVTAHSEGQAHPPAVCALRVPGHPRLFWLDAMMKANLVRGASNWYSSHKSDTEILATKCRFRLVTFCSTVRCPLVCCLLVTSDAR